MGCTLAWCEGGVYTGMVTAGWPSGKLRSRDQFPLYLVSSGYPASHLPLERERGGGGGGGEGVGERERERERERGRETENV